MTGAQISEGDYAGDVQLPTDYSERSLPPWVGHDWWHGDRTDSGPAYWATLDIELAYPSVRLERLRHSMSQMLENVDVGEGVQSGYPAHVIETLADDESRGYIGMRLMDALERVSIDHGLVPLDAWQPCHAPTQLPPINKGIPTGLAISGMLLNVALHPTDMGVLRYLRRQQGERRGAIVRFADDMCIFSRSISGLLSLIDEVWRALAGSRRSRLAVPMSASNLHLNFAKVGPQPIQDIVSRFLEYHRWSKCPDCGQLHRRHRVRRALSLVQWWESRAGAGERAGMETAVARALIRSREVGPFVTTLVARLSEIARDTLAERFGEGAKARLIRLHELARLDIEDEQVRSDTRRAFAVNRLVRAWLPADEGDAKKAIVEIRESVSHVLRTTPWKFSLWRAVVRAAAQRPVGEDRDEAGRDAGNWLDRQLGRIAHAPEADDPESWMFMWPEEVEGHSDKRRASWVALYLSFHRTAFWHALGDVLLELRRHHDRAMHPYVGDVGPPPRWWTVRAMPTGHHENVIAFLGDLDRWARRLYAQAAVEPDLAAWPWELDQFVIAMLASAGRYEAAQGWRYSEPPADVPVVPELPFADHMPAAVGLLERAGRVSLRRRWPRSLNASALAHTSLSGPDYQLHKVLFPDRGRPRVAGTGADPRHAVSIAVNLECSDSIGTDLVEAAIRKRPLTAQLIGSDPLTLFEYRRARRVLLSRR